MLDKNTTFDEALPNAVDVVFTTIPDLRSENVRFIRDISGLIYVVTRAQIDDESLTQLRHQLHNRLDSYSPGQEACAERADKIFDGEAIFEEKPLVVNIHNKWIHFIERRVAGQDWVKLPTTRQLSPHRFVFYSLKGGVGRSTALAACGWRLAEEGYTVLTLDLDLEGPGLAAQMLHPDQLPKHGALDWLVEDNVREVSDDFVDDMAAPSPIADAGLLVVPAFGNENYESYPSNVIAKFARAYLEEEADEMAEGTFVHRLRRMLDQLERVHSADVVLIDSRSGLHETVAANLMHLEAQVFMFATDAPPTWSGYYYLFSHLRMLVQSQKHDNQIVSDDWRGRIKMVHARAELKRNTIESFIDSSYRLWTNSLYDNVAPTRHDDPLPCESSDDFLELDDSRFSHDIRDEAAPHYPLIIPRNDQLERFTPVTDLDTLGTRILRRDFDEIYLYIAGKLTERTGGDDEH